MDIKYQESVKLIKNYVENEPNIMGALILGSQVRKEYPGDEWSDLDVLIFTKEIAEYIDSEKWLDLFGNVVCVSKEIVDLSWINLTWYVNRILYDDNRVIDFSIMPYNKIDDVLEINKEIHSLGYEVIYDGTCGYLSSQIEKTILTIDKGGKPSISINNIDSTINDILFHIIYALKKVKRKELWVAVSEINCYLKDKLLQIIEVHNSIVTNKFDIIMYEGRLIENRTDIRILNMLKNCFAYYNEESAITALEHIINISYKIYKEICIKIRYEVNEEKFESLRKIFYDINKNEFRSER